MVEVLRGREKRRGEREREHNLKTRLFLSLQSLSTSFFPTMKLAAASNARAATAVSTRSSVRAAAAATPAAPSRRSVGAALLAAVPAVMLAAAQPGAFRWILFFRADFVPGG